MNVEQSHQERGTRTGVPEDEEFIEREEAPGFGDLIRVERADGSKRGGVRDALTERGQRKFQTVANFSKHSYSGVYKGQLIRPGMDTRLGPAVGIIQPVYDSTNTILYQALTKIDNQTQLLISDS